MRDSLPTTKDFRKKTRFLTIGAQVPYKNTQRLAFYVGKKTAFLSIGA